jgi:hypothetical protein
MMGAPTMHRRQTQGCCWCGVRARREACRRPVQAPSNNVRVAANTSIDNGCANEASKMGANKYRTAGGANSAPEPKRVAIQSQPNFKRQVLNYTSLLIRPSLRVALPSPLRPFRGRSNDWRVTESSRANLGSMYIQLHLPPPQFSEICLCLLAFSPALPTLVRLMNGCGRW